MPSVSADVLLYAWEVLLDAIVGGKAPLANRIDLTTRGGPSLLRRLTDALGRVAPEELLATLPPEIVPGSAPREILGSLVDACWRLRRPAQLLAWAGADVVPKEGLLDAETAAIGRLSSWATWELHNRDDARSFLTTNIHRVVEPAERARWADQKATFCRFAAGTNWMEAETDYHQSLALRSADDGIGYAMTLQNLAFLYLEQGEFDQSYRFMRRTSEHGETHSYDGSHVSLLVGLLGMAWIDLINGHPLRTARAGQLLDQAGKHMRSRRMESPRDLRCAAKALQNVRARRRGYDWKLSDQLLAHFWSRLIVEQLRVLDGKDSDAAALDVLHDFPRPQLVPERLPFLLGLLRPSDEPQVSSVHAPAHQQMAWPLSYLAQLGAQSTLGAIQAMELLLHLYESVCIACAQGSPALERQTANTRIRSLRQLTRLTPVPLANEVADVLAIVEEALPARNRLVHGAGKIGDVKTIELGHSLAIEQSKLLRQIRWSSSNPVTGDAPGLSFSAAAFCQVDGKEMVIHLGDTEIRSAIPLR